MEARIIDRGRGPEIEGTRITVYDVMDYHKHGWEPSRIAAVFRDITAEQIVAAIGYIESHKAEVLAEYQQMLDRDAQGNPPELQARLDETHRRFLAMCRQRGLKLPEAFNGAEASS